MNFLRSLRSPFQRHLREPQQSEPLLSDSVNDLFDTVLPRDVIIKIFHCLGVIEQRKLSSVCRTWRKITQNQAYWLPLIIFQSCDWTRFIGNVGEQAPISEELKTHLHAPCPFYPHLFVWQTHYLTWIPTHLNGEELTSVNFKDKVTCVRWTNFNDTLSGKGHGYWLLSVKKCLNAHRKNDLLAGRNPPHYLLPTALEAMIILSLHYLKNGGMLPLNRSLATTLCDNSCPTRNDNHAVVDMSCREKNITLAYSSPNNHFKAIAVRPFTSNASSDLNRSK
ncbi:MAG: F-box protein [Chlamydiia bacterium]|nr:F-box protein [Chlamydiia bacterium]